MSEYRIYCLDAQGRIGFAQWLEADTDEEAIGEARRLRPDAMRCEIWEYGRLVTTLNGEGASVDRPQGVA